MVRNDAVIVMRDTGWSWFISFLFLNDLMGNLPFKRPIVVMRPLVLLEGLLAVK